MNKKWALWAGAALGASALIPGAAQAQAPQAGGPFADVPQDHWAYDAVQEMAQARRSSPDIRMGPSAAGGR